MESSAQNTSQVVRLADLTASGSYPFAFVPSADQTQTLKDTLALDGLRKVRIAGMLRPIGKKDWELTGQIGATVIQPCVMTFKPVTTRIDAEIGRLYMAQPPALPSEGEVEMPEDDRIELLPDSIDLLNILAEELSLALPLYPKVSEARLEETTFTEPGKTPMQDEDARPFAALAGLRKKLEDPGKNDP
jgi:uncharacterized metal-binding protein YceD (DUF177 family)